MTNNFDQFDTTQHQYFISTYKPIKRETFDFEMFNFMGKTCDWYADDLETVKIGQGRKVRYL